MESKIKKVILFVSVGLSVNHNTQCPNIQQISLVAIEPSRKVEIFFHFYNSSQAATAQTVSVLLQWQFYYSKIDGQFITPLYPAIGDWCDICQPGLIDVDFHDSFEINSEEAKDY